MVYKWKPTARISKVDPQKVGELMRELADSNSLTAQNLVEISKPENSLLHNTRFKYDIEGIGDLSLLEDYVSDIPNEETSEDPDAIVLPFDGGKIV